MSQIVSLLENIPVHVLAGFFGDSNTRALADCGIPISSRNLAEAIYAEKGLKLLRNPELRTELLLALGREKLSRIFSPATNLSDAVLSSAEFTWGNNKKTKNFLSLVGLDHFDIKNESSLGDYSRIRPDALLHGYQNSVRKKIAEFLGGSDGKKAIVHMPTGAGKTRTSLEAVCDFYRKQADNDVTVVWLAHSQELCQQSLDSFKNIWRRLGPTEVDVIGLWGGAALPDTDMCGSNFVVISLNTAFGMLKSRSDQVFSFSQLIARKCKLIIVDEAHQSTAPTYKIAIEGLSNHKTKVLGLTATPGRHHLGEDAASSDQLAEFYERRKISIADSEGRPLADPIGYLTEEGILAKVDRFQIKSDQSLELTQQELRSIQEMMDLPASVLKRLGKDAQRTSLVATAVLKLAIEQSKPTIVFAPSVENSVMLSILLKMKGCAAESITSEMDSHDRYDAIERFKSGSLPVIVNYGVLTTGFDAPNIKAVVIARPTMSVVLYSQMIGRGLRGPRMGGESECVVVDVIDNIANMPSAAGAFVHFDQFYSQES